MAWTKASPPVEPGGAVLLPGEVELRTRRERDANGVPLDPETRAQIVEAGALVGVAVDTLEAPATVPSVRRPSLGESHHRCGKIRFARG